MNNIFSLKNKVAFVTGAYGYLGEIFVYALARCGAIVYANGRDKFKIQELIKSYPDFDIRPAVFDVTDEDALKNFIENYNFNKLDIIVNNAYSGRGGQIKTSLISDYINSMSYSVHAPQILTKNFLPFLEESAKIGAYPSVINIASMYGLIIPDLSIYDDEENSNPPFYGSSKAAMIHWSKYASVEFGSEGIRFNTISPGPFPDPSKVSDNVFISKLKQKVPMGRIGELEDLIGPIIFLASESSKYITGENIIVDGGWTV